MEHDDQISDYQFNEDLEVYRKSSEPSEITATIYALRAIKFVPIRVALREAVRRHLSKMEDGAQEYDDILAGQKIYQETQEG